MTLKSKFAARNLSKKAIITLIAINLFMAVASNIVDWYWLMSVEWYLMPFTPICSLYPLTLGIWFLIYLKKRKVPNWFTSFIFIGIVSYGIAAWFYFPIYMAWDGIHWRMIGNMIWVTIYALQSLIIASELRPLKIYQYIPIFAYFYFKDYADRYLGTFIDLLRPDFPEVFKTMFIVIILILHTGAIALMLKVSYSNKKQTHLRPAQEPATGTVT